MSRLNPFLFGPFTCFICGRECKAQETSHARFCSEPHCKDCAVDFYYWEEVQAEKFDIKEWATSRKSFFQGKGVR